MVSPGSVMVATAVDQAPGLQLCHPDQRHGLGVRTLVARAAGEVIEAFSGSVGPEIRQHSLQTADGRHISDTRFVGFLSHGCDPNCRLDMSRFELIALRDVPAGGVLTVDYAHTEDRLYRQFACHCGSQDCRHWITGRAEALDAEGLAYLAGPAGR